MKTKDLPGEQIKAKDLLLEIGTEEIPARFMPAALQQLGERAGRLLKESRLDYMRLTTMGTPRRMVLRVDGLEAAQKSRREKKKGPSREAAYDAVGHPTPAARGFASKLGVRLEDLEIEEMEKGEYLVAVQEIQGEKTPKVLFGLLPALLRSLAFPKTMSWEASKVRFARPLRWLLCLYGEEEISFSYAGLEAGRKTWGHRFLSPGSFPVRDPDHYFSVLEQGGVVLDPAGRSAMISEQAGRAAAAAGVEPILEHALLEEVTFLVENPSAVLCSFPESYLQLPRDVLVTTMQSHQRYFPTRDAAGAISSYFVAVSNNPRAPGENIRSGNEKVLKARLADASFFYKEDLKSALADYVESLKTVLFQEELGTVYEKTMRMTTLVEFLADRLPTAALEEREAASRAAYLSKADLVTNMVGEFPELQGIMGQEYALKSSESPQVARAILEHYRPRFAGDQLPETLPGALVSIADKLDHLAGCFAIGIRPTGSQDPYALRRQGLGLLQVLLEHDIDVSFREMVGRALELFQSRLQDLDIPELSGEITEFTWHRARHLFQERGLDYDLVEAILHAPLDRLPVMARRLVFLQEKRADQRLADAATAYIRLANLAGRAAPGVQVEEGLLREKAELGLHEKARAAAGRLQGALAKNDLPGALSVLSGLKPDIDIFFDEVLVMVDDDALRRNRLALLRQLQNIYLDLADFSKIVFPS